MYGFLHPIRPGLLTLLPGCLSAVLWLQLLHLNPRLSLRLARPPRVGRACVFSWGCSGLDSRAVGFRLRDEGGGFDDGVTTGREESLELAEPAESLAEERVTLDDMRTGSVVILAMCNEKRSSFGKRGSLMECSR